MDKAKIEDALQNLLDRKLIKPHNNIYTFTSEGWGYSENRSRNSWCDITWHYDDKDRLWVPFKIFENEHDWDWTFIEYDEVTEEQFTNFCKYFDIDVQIDNDLLDLDDIIL